jgi:hypothetical protein
MECYSHVFTNLTEHFILPFFISPWRRMHDRLIIGAPEWMVTVGTGRSAKQQYLWPIYNETERRQPCLWKNRSGCTEKMCIICKTGCGAPHEECLAEKPNDIFFHCDICMRERW